MNDISFVKYYNNTSYGKAGIEWKQENGHFKMEVIVPVGSYATAYVPGDKNSMLTENGKIINEQPFVNIKSK